MKSFRIFLIDLGLVGGSIVMALLLVSLALAMGGHPRGLLDWAQGAAGTRADLLMSLKNACPLILTGLAAAVAFRSGVFNIGAEGQSIVGTIAAVTLATRALPHLSSPLLAIPLCILAGAIGGAIWALIPALLDRLRGVPVVLSTILLNFIALQLLRMLIEGPLRAITIKTSVPQSDPLIGGYILPIFLQSGAGQLHVGIIIALVIAAACWIVQARTAYGFEILVTGLNPVAARYAGMPVAARQFGIMLWSGAFAGIGGTIQLMGVEGAHSLGTDPVSYGYAGIAVALLGRLHPAGVVAAAIFFALLDHGADSLEFTTNIPHELSDIVKGLIVLIILCGTAYVASRRRTAMEH
ncbi:MAG TPA: ABC transporter permease [Phycisphaerae bacterium]